MSSVVLWSFFFVYFGDLVAPSFTHSFFFFHSPTHTHTHTPWSRHQWGVCTLRRCWRRAYQSTWCTRASRPSSHISSHAGCRGSSSSRSDQSWWRWDNSWDLRTTHKWLSDGASTGLDVSFTHQMGTVLPFLTSPWFSEQCKSTLEGPIHQRQIHFIYMALTTSCSWLEEL